MNTIYKKDKYQRQEELLYILKQRLEDCWSGASEALEQLEDCYYDIANDKRLNELADIKEKAMDIQGETQNSIDNFVEQFNLNEEV